MITYNIQKFQRVCNQCVAEVAVAVKHPVSGALTPVQVFCFSWIGHYHPVQVSIVSIWEAPPYDRGFRILSVIDLDALGRELAELASVNSRGGKQSKCAGRFDLIPQLALARVAQVLEHGAINYGEDNWRQIEVTDHINHAMQHTNAFLAGDTSEGGDTVEHLAHTATRALFALELALCGHVKG